MNNLGDSTTKRHSISKQVCKSEGFQNTVSIYTGSRKCGVDKRHERIFQCDRLHIMFVNQPQALIEQASRSVED